jgi:signal transduction histidine kinase
MRPAAEKTEHRRGVTTARRLVATTFVLVGLGVLAATLFALTQTREIQSGTRDIVDNMAARAHVLGQVDHLIERRRILVDDHIFAKDPPEMAKLEAQLGTSDRDLSVAIHEYEPWATLPGERATWDRAREALAALDEPMAQAIALSRLNRDAEARQVMDRVAGRFEEINRSLDELTAINDQGSGMSLARLSSVRERLQLILLLVGAVALVATALLGVWAARQVGRREQELARSAQALAVRNRELDAFAGRVAHDIRSPLSSMKLAITSFSEAVLPPDRTLKILRRSTQRMEALVDDLMTLALSEGASHGRCDPAQVAQQVQDDFKTRLDAAKGDLRLKVAHAEVACSEGLLHQALSNLLENAVKYHRPHVPPVVELEGASTDGGYDLRVSDNGTGMSDEEAARAFEPFYRSPRATELPGTGLGLSIVNRIAEVSGGSLSLRSKEGEGLDLRDAHPPRDAAALTQPTPASGALERDEPRDRERVLRAPRGRRGGVEGAGGRAIVTVLDAGAQAQALDVVDELEGGGGLGEPLRRPGGEAARVGEVFAAQGGREPRQGERADVGGDAPEVDAAVAVVEAVVGARREREPLGRLPNDRGVEDVAEGEGRGELRGRVLGAGHVDERDLEPGRGLPGDRAREGAHAAAVEDDGVPAVHPEDRHVERVREGAREAQPRVQRRLGPGIEERARVIPVRERLVVLEAHGRAELADVDRDGPLERKDDGEERLAEVRRRAREVRVPRERGILLLEDVRGVAEAGVDAEPHALRPPREREARVVEREPRLEVERAQLVPPRGRCVEVVEPVDVREPVEIDVVDALVRVGRGPARARDAAREANDQEGRKRLHAYRPPTLPRPRRRARLRVTRR